MSAPLALLLLPLSFLVALGWGPWFIGTLRRHKVGKQIRVDGPAAHQSKAGTPTMGGWLFLLTTAALSLVFIRDLVLLVVALGAMLSFGLLGSIDDYANLRSRQGYGLRVRLKLLVHTLLAAVIAAGMYWLFDYRDIALPGERLLPVGWWYVPLATLAIFATASGVNEIDGLDGLAGGTSALAYAAYLVIALGSGRGEIAAFCAIVIGAVLAFLWFNVHPARVFMGDAGALALGAGLAVVALMTNWVLLLPVIGLLFVVELLSVVLQVAYFRLTGGRRVFKMSPLHHHLELSGWAEEQIVQRFWLLGALAAAAGVALAFL